MNYQLNSMENVLLNVLMVSFLTQKVISVKIVIQLVINVMDQVKQTVYNVLKDYFIMVILDNVRQIVLIWDLIMLMLMIELVKNVIKVA